MAVNRVNIFRAQAWLDERTFEAIFFEHYSRVYAVLFRLTGDRFEADDLAAETFWRLWERPPAQTENLAGWLYRVATRLGYNLLRTHKRREQYEDQAGRQAAAVNSAPPHSDPASEAETRDERQRVRAVLRQMPLKDVQLLVLRHSGLSYGEIAAALGLTSASIGKMLSRAEDRFEALYRQGENHAPKP